MRLRKLGPRGASSLSGVEQIEVLEIRYSGARGDTD
jgi:hypothetical protein